MSPASSLGAWSLATAAIVLVLGAGAVQAKPVRGSLVQLSGPFGCLSDGGAGNCATVGALGGAASVAVAPEGRDVYVAANNSGAIVAFRRDPRTGILRERGCLATQATPGCIPARGMTGAFAVALSPDGRSVYVAGFRSLAVFSRDPDSGALSQLPGTQGCVSQDGAEGCAPGRALAGVASVSVSPDGRNVYAASVASNAVAVFERDVRTGAIGQLPGTHGCVSQGGSEDCEAVRAISGAFSVTVSPNGKQAYVAALNANAVAVFDRDPGGSLIQLEDTDGCISQTGDEGCAGGRGLASPNAVSVSPDGRNVYVASSGSGAIAVLARDTGLGTVVQLRGARGCTSQGGSEGCATGRALGGSFAVTTSLDGANTYAVSSSGVVSFQRDPQSGVLLESPDPETCTTQGGTEDCVTGRALREASSIALSPDGRNAYVASFRSNAVAVFARNPQRVRVGIRLAGVPRRCVRRTFRVRVRVHSKLPMQRVRLGLDRRSLGSRERTRRLVVRIKARALRRGRHRLMIRARDVGGNVARRTARFRRCRS